MDGSFEELAAVVQNDQLRLRCLLTELALLSAYASESSARIREIAAESGTMLDDLIARTERLARVAANDRQRRAAEWMTTLVRHAASTYSTRLAELACSPLPSGTPSGGGSTRFRTPRL